MAVAPVAPFATKSRPTRNFSATASACQRATGTGHADVLGFSENDVAMVGTLSFHEGTGDSGKSVSRGFCPKCGSPLLWKFAANPGLAIIMAGSLDDPSVFKPQAVTFASQGHAWDHLKSRTAEV